MKRLLIYIPLALMLLILGASTAILLFLPQTVGYIRDVDVRATEARWMATLQGIDSTAQFLADINARDFSLNLTRTAIATQTDETIGTRQAQAFATEQWQVNQMQRTQNAQSTHIIQAQGTLGALQTQVVATATMNHLVSSVTMTAGAQFSMSNNATRDAVQQVQEHLHLTSTAVIGAVQTNSVQSAMLSATEMALIGIQTQIAQDAHATQTAIVMQNIAQATQNAMDFEATQSILQIQATQNALNFAMTQSAINQNATEVALGFATPLPTPQPTPTPSATIFVDTFGGRQP